jgi:hypothetical protein
MAEKRSDQQGQGFTVKDRRFSSQTEDAAATPGASDKAATETPRQTQEEAANAAADTRNPLPEISFSTFILSLNSSVLVHLGLLADPSTGQTEKNLPLAKQTIDLLGLLEEKTAGNLTTDEANLLKHLLYDLRINYIRLQG